MPNISLGEAALVPDDTVGGDVEDAPHKNGSIWIERISPELEWDESEAVLIVEDIVDGSRMRGYT